MSHNFHWDSPSTCPQKKSIKIRSFIHLSKLQFYHSTNRGHHLPTDTFDPWCNVELISYVAKEPNWSKLRKNTCKYMSIWNCKSDLLLIKYVGLFAHTRKSKMFLSFLNLNGKHFFSQWKVSSICVINVFKNPFPIVNSRPKYNLK